MKVDPLKAQIQQNKDRLQNMVKTQKKNIQLRENEIKKVEDIYQDRIEDKKLQGEIKLLDLNERNLKQVDQINERKEKKLANLKEHLSSTQERLSQEEERLKDSNNKAIDGHRRTHALRTEHLYEKAKSRIQDINTNNNFEIRKVYDDTNRAISEVRYKSNLKVNEVAQNSANKVTQATSGQANQLKAATSRFQAMVAKKDIEHKAAVKELERSQEKELIERSAIQKDELVRNESLHKTTLLTEKESFESKYKKLVEDHKKVLKRLEDNFAAEVKQKDLAFSKSRKIQETRESDDFYQVTRLEPQITEDEKFYYINIKTPEHEKENYNLTAHDRTIRLSFHRRAEKRVEGESEGEVFKTQRAESLTREFKVDNIVKDKKLKMAYNNGVLSYRLPKA